MGDFTEPLALVKSENHLAAANNQTENAAAQADNLVYEDDSSTSSVTWGSKSDVISNVGISDL